MKNQNEENLIEEILDRGVENIYPSREFLEKKLRSEEILRLYTGYDPTAPFLTLGHAVTLLKLKQFQELGHKIIILIGDFTAMIGDPTGKSKARVKLTAEQVKKNYQVYREQIGKIIDLNGLNPAEMKFNSQWLGKLNFSEIIELASNFTVQRMLERDMFEKRMKEEKPIYLHEFLYPLMQGYDSVVMDIDGEVGGNDQTFNMLAGRALMKNLKNKEKFVLTLKLLTDSSGTKMSKSEGTSISLAETPENMFGKVMSWDDSMIINGFIICTRVPMAEIQIMEKQMKNDEVNPRDLKIKLAFEITRTLLGDKEAETGKNNFERVIQKKEEPAKILFLKPKNYRLVFVLVEAKLAASYSEARRLIEQGGVKVNFIKATSPLQILKGGDVLRKGKLNFLKIK
jgi:tyrosyl-tRNA synthetase